SRSTSGRRRRPISLPRSSSRSPWRRYVRESLSEMAEPPLVSIVTPSYNQGRFVEATIRSVLDQRSPRIEHIVVDGGSTDGTLDVLARYPKVKWTSEPDSGQADAVNKGFRRAAGEIVGWLNSDDLYLESAVAEAVAYLQEH